MKKRKVDPWFPFWIDKWLFGSTRIELEPDERGVFVDLMSLSKKDDGYIRANEGMPYLDSQLCGLLNITTELFHRTVEKCIKYGKAKKLKDGTLYMTSHEVYKLSERQERRVKREMADSEDAMAEKTDTKIILDKKRIEENILRKKQEKKKKKEAVKKLLDIEFEEFWKFYHTIGNKGDDIGDKKEAKKAYNILRKKESKGNIVKAANGYGEFLKYKDLKEGFKQRKLYASTFLRSKKWERFLTFKYTPSL